MIFKIESFQHAYFVDRSLTPLPLALSSSLFCLNRWNDNRTRDTERARERERVEHAVLRGNLIKQSGYNERAIDSERSRRFSYQLQDKHRDR